MRKHWFLPENPDVLGTLREQADTTVEGAAAFAAWADGEAAQGAAVRACEHRADALRRRLSDELRQAFSTPIDQEDLFTLAERLDVVLNGLKNVVRDAEAYAVAPDAPMARMAADIEAGVRHLHAALTHLTDPGDLPTREADAAVACERRMEEAYREAMRGLLALGDLREVAARGELYRRTLEVGERITRVADRVWYAVVKEA
ncbi:DUF47 family protein [Nocardioides sp. GY 10113]|uniref:DUF47 domain-containing protein n=1 Tax=Nocardioides sp. GY 10113 TaxID=2569761 RepID=UPI0010A7FF25|nr:DUF47 family protein [Nocardioides sp. GY 10113]TIC81328.1 DUF47 family protein [Nocardioides sp. GY 10113]